MSKFALRALRSSGVFSVTRSLSARMARILMYHNFSGPNGSEPDALNVEGVRLQFDYLQRYFRVVPLLQLAEQVASGRKLDRLMVALTIDDGRRSCYEYLFPLLKEFGLPATFFVVSSFISGQDWIWTDKVIWLSERPNPPQNLVPGKLDEIFSSLNRMRPEDRNARIQSMAKSAGIVIPRVAPEKYRPCSWSELREMADSGLVEIGSHTVTHPILSSVTDEESWEELTRSRTAIADGTGRTVSSFCFPNGLSGDVRPSQVRQVREAGYAFAVIAELGMVSAGSDPYQLPRIGMARKSSPEQVAKYLDGFAYYQQKFGAARGSGLDD